MRRLLLNPTSRTLITTFKAPTTQLNRLLSTPPPLPPPPQLSVKMCKGIIESTSFLLTHGLPSKNLISLSEQTPASNLPGSHAEGDIRSLVQRWQRMMETFFGAQVHILVGCGFPQSEQGLQVYNRLLSDIMGNSEPKEQEELRVASRDLWRLTLSKAFDVDTSPVNGNELSVPDAREIMYGISQKMVDASFLGKVAEKCGKLNEGAAPQERHTLLQELLISEVYLNSSSSTSVCSRFGQGEIGYVLLQSALAEHQHDPLISQYIGKSMVEVMKAGGISMEAIKAQAGSQ